MNFFAWVETTSLKGRRATPRALSRRLPKKTRRRTSPKPSMGATGGGTFMTALQSGPQNLSRTFGPWAVASRYWATVSTPGGILKGLREKAERARAREIFSPQGKALEKSKPQARCKGAGQGVHFRETSLPPGVSQA